MKKFNEFIVEKIIAHVQPSGHINFSKNGERLSTVHRKGDDHHEYLTKQGYKFVRHVDGVGGSMYIKEAFPFGSHDDVEAETPHIKISHSLLIRLFEYFHENSSYNDDEDIHDITELIFDVGSDGEVVGMDDYDYIIGNDEEDDEFTEETETAGQIKRKIVQKHAGHFPQAAQDYLHKSKTYGNKAYDYLEANHGIKIGHAKAAIDKIKDDMKASLGSSKSSSNAERIDRYLSQKWISPRGNR